MVKVVVYANKNHAGLVNLYSSFKTCSGWEVTNIGHNDLWQGWTTRMKAYLLYCQSCDPSEYIVLSDAFDVLCIRSSEGFMEAIATNYDITRIVVGAENMCYPHNCVQLHKYWESKPSAPENKYCNGGMMAGPAGQLAIMWEWCLKSGIHDDQIAIGNYMNEYVDRCQLDIDRIIVFNDYLASMKYTMREDRTLLYQDKVWLPFFIHFHGVNAVSSIPLFQNPWYPFMPGINYKQVGKQINGNDHIMDLPVSGQSYILGLFGERLIFLVIIIVLIIICCRVRR